MSPATTAPGPIPPAPTAPFSRRFLGATTFGLVIALGLLGWFLLHRFPARFHGSDWLTSEQGNQLYRAQVLGAGGLLYRDVECQYGPLPVYAYAAFAKVFGNTVQTGVAFHLCVSLAVVAVLFRWLARAARSRRELLLLTGLLGMASLALTVFYRSPLILSLGANVEYLSFERLWLVGLAAGWRPLRERTGRDMLRIGLFLWLWQLTKFGGGLFGVAAFIGADLAFLLTCAQREDRRAFLPFWLRTAIICLGSEVVRAALFYAVLPLDLATRSPWPLWIMGHYPYDRLTLWPTWHIFMVYTAPILVPAVAGVTWTSALLLPQIRMRLTAWLPADLWFPVLVPLSFYLGGSVNRIGYFGREWIFYQWAWALAPALLSLALRLPRVAGLLLALVAYAASAGMFLRSANWQPSPPQLLQLVTPVGPVWGHSDDPDLKIWQAVHTWLDRHPGARLIVLSEWSGGGWYAARHEPAPLRNMLFMAGVRTKADDQEFQQALRQTQMLVCLLPTPPQGAAAAGREDRLRRELLRLLPAELARQVLGEYRIAETDPQLETWVMLRRRTTD